MRRSALFVVCVGLVLAATASPAPATSIVARTPASPGVNCRSS